MIALRVLAAFCVVGSIASAQIIVDTDAGSDDVIAVALLLANHRNIEAITVVNGMAHVEAGARNMRGLLHLAGRAGVPVFLGRTAPMRGNRDFPADWRQASDHLPGVQLPLSQPLNEHTPAATYLVERLRTAQTPVQILALGPLTNIAEALRSHPAIARDIFEIVIMGGAIHVPGNAPGALAEWNMYIDPLAAQIVFRSGVPIRVIPLNATNKVPLNREFVRDFQAEAHSSLGRVVAQVLQTDQDMIDAGTFYAWDPLAAAALLDPRLVTTVPMHIEITDEGRMMASSGPPNAKVAVDADASRFGPLLLRSFAGTKAGHP